MPSAPVSLPGLPAMPQVPASLPGLPAMPQGVPSLPALAPGVANMANQLPPNMLGQAMPPMMSGLGPMMDTEKPNAIAALQMKTQMNQGLPFGTQNTEGQMLSAIQSQYQSQLDQYKKSQQQFADWAKKYEDYEHTVSTQQQAYEMEQQQYQNYQRQMLAQQLRAGTAPRTALVQTGSRSETAHAEAAMSSREQALAARGKALAKREAALRKKAADVRAKEVQEQQEQAKLDAKEKAVEAEEKKVKDQQKQLQKFEGELVNEQRKIWKVLKARQAGAPQTSSNAPAKSPSHTPKAAVKRPTLAKRPAVKVRPAKVKVAGAVKPAKVKVAAAQAAPLALAQMSSTARLQKSQTQVLHRGASSGRAASKTGTKKLGKSDLHVVMAATVPKEGTFAEDDAGVDDSITGDNEDTNAVRNSNSRANADNDDLEQLFIQESSSGATQSTDDAVED